MFEKVKDPSTIAAMPEVPELYRNILFALSVPGSYFLLVWAGRRLKRAHGVQLGWLYHALALCLAVFVPAMILKMPWNFLRHLGAATVILASGFFIAVIDRYVFELYLQKRHGVKVPKFLTEVTRIIIVLVAFFLVLQIGYDQSIKGLLIAPGIAALVIGLAMQDLLGNIIAGLALQAGKSFEHGDWLLVDNRRAEVIEINWRSTRLRTVDDISIEIPNREIARQTIINLNRPTRTHAMCLPITLDYATPPTRAKDVLYHAVANAKGVAPEPKPRVFLKNFGDSGMEYEIKFWMEDHQFYADVCDAIRTNAWYGLRRHGLKIPYPIRTVQLERPARDRQHEVQSAARSILREQPLFRCLSDEQLDALLPRGRAVHYGRGENLIQQGEAGDSMFILVEGEASVMVRRNGAAQQVACLGAGDCFGEMSLLTGEKRTATVLAQTDCEVVEITKPVLARSLKEHPELLSQLSNLLAERQIRTEGVFADATSKNAGPDQNKYAAGFLDRLRSFFEL